MQNHEVKINEDTLEGFFNLHLKVLERVIENKDFADIHGEYAQEFERFNYLEVASMSLLSFNDEKRLRAAYPLSPGKTDYQISVEGIGSGYALCAIDSLGVAYTFNAKTSIDSIDPASDSPIKITIDPNNLDIKPYSDIVVTVPKSLPKKKNGESIDPAVDFCPLIGFIKNTSSIPEDQHDFVDVIPFDHAFAYGKQMFDPVNIKQEIRTGLTNLLMIYRSGVLSEDEVVKTHMKNTTNSSIKALTPEQAKAFLIPYLKGRKVVKKSEQLNHLELTDLGKRIIETFLG